MATKLQCEICGGKLIGKPGGIFECESCGTEYSTAWAKEKIQEITGVVRVEGAVEVTGKVQVEGPIKVEESDSKVKTLLDRGEMSLVDLHWDKAKEYFDQVLSIDSHCAEAYLGLAMADSYCRTRAEYAKKYVNQEGYLYLDRNAGRAKSFGDEAIKAWFAELEEGRNANITAKKEEKDRQKENDYVSACDCQNNGTVKMLDEAVKLFSKLNGYKDSLERIRVCQNAKRAILRQFKGNIAGGMSHTACLKADGTVVATGENNRGQCDVSSWHDIVAISAGGENTVGLKTDGTVVAVGDNSDGCCNVSNWKNIVAISMGTSHLVALKTDGTVIALGSNSSGQCDVVSWHNIVAISAGGYYTVGLKSDGTVVATGENERGQCNVSSWREIVAISAGSEHTAGLRTDGTVVATGNNENGQCDVSSWRDVVAISAGLNHTVGLNVDGTVVATKHRGSEDDYYGQCDVSSWSDIVTVFAGFGNTIGLKSDGMLLATGLDAFGVLNIHDWQLFKSEDEIVSDYAIACDLQKTGSEENLYKAAGMFVRLRGYLDSEERAKNCLDAVRQIRDVVIQERRAALHEEQSRLQAELPNLKGLFSSNKRMNVEYSLAQIKKELEEL